MGKSLVIDVEPTVPGRTANDERRGVDLKRGPTPQCVWVDGASRTLGFGSAVFFFVVAGLFSFLFFPDIQKVAKECGRGHAPLCTPRLLIVGRPGHTCPHAWHRDKDSNLAPLAPVWSTTAPSKSMALTMQFVKLLLALMVALVFTLMPACVGAATDVSAEEDNLRASIADLQSSLAELERNSDEYFKVKGDLSEGKILLKNLKWKRVGLSDDDYATLCNLDIELDELRSMPPTLIIELPEEDRKERLMEMRSLKDQVKKLTEPLKSAMKQLVASERLKQPPPPKLDGRHGTERVVGRVDDDSQQAPSSLENRERKRIGGLRSSGNTDSSVSAESPTSIRGGIDDE